MSYSWSSFFSAFAPKFKQKFIDYFEVGEYQGDGLCLLQDAEGNYGIVSYYYGSCSECDTLLGMESESELEEYAASIFNHVTPLDRWLKEIEEEEDFLFSDKLVKQDMMEYLKNHKII